MLRKSALARRACTAAAALIALCLPSWAAAHVDGKVSVRVVHLTYAPAGMTAYYRMSLAPLGPAPYVLSRKESGQWFHYVDTGALSARSAALVLAAGHAVSVDGAPVAPSLLAAAIHVKGRVPPFATPDQARAACEDAAPPANDANPPEIDHVVLDAALFYPGVQAAPLRLRSSLDARALSDAPLRTILLSHRGRAIEQYRPADTAALDIDINPGLWMAAWQFVQAGAAHILEGMDHLLLVVCLVAADLRLRAIALRITAFSAGHAASIVASFYRLLPDAAWLIPGVELLIALSVFGTALLMLRARERRSAATMTFVVGLIHGCGLAAGLRAILSDTGPNVIASLVFFNAGVELGQLLIAAAVGLLLLTLRACAPANAGQIRQLLALAVATLSLAWIGERAAPLWEALQAAGA